MRMGASVSRPARPRHAGRMDVALRIAGLFLYALLFAAVEIEIEGEHGWAERLPTWYRLTPRYARAFSFLLSGKPLTGYHAVMFFVPLASFHLGFLFGLSWSGLAAPGAARRSRVRSSGLELFSGGVVERPSGGVKMGFRDQVVIVANDEADVTWWDYTDRILEYFATSTGQTWTREAARK